MKGQWVAVELGVNIYWKELVRANEKSEKKFMEELLEMRVFFLRDLTNEEPGTIVIQNIF
jgi:hypothetical protein